MALTDAKIRALKPKATRYKESDGNGLTLEVLPSGKMSWLYRYRLDGKAEKVVLGRYPDLTLKAARAKRDELASVVAGGRSPAEEKKRFVSGGDPTVAEFGARFYREQIAKKWKDPRPIERLLENQIFPALGQKRLKDVTVADVQAFVYRKRDNGRKAAAMQLKAVLRQMFAYALELQLVTFSPPAMLATKYIGTVRKRARVLSGKEIKLYLRTIYASNIRRQFKLALHILLLTMTRKCELLLARWEHVDFEAGEWLIPAEHSKNKKPHIVYLSTQVAEMFRELKVLAGDSAQVLPGRSSTKTFSENALNKALTGLTFDMEHMTIHDLRRTGATLLTEKGWNRDVIEKALNHTREGIRAHYILAEHAAERRKMLQWWADYVDGLVNESKVLMGNFGAATA